MELVAYADESGTHDPSGVQPGSEVAAIVGYVSWKEDWDKFFTPAWQSVLSEYGVAVFHMSEFMDQKNGPSKPEWPYGGWSKDKRDVFARRLISTAVENSLFAVGGVLNVRDYDAVSPDWLKSETEHPYHFCFQLFFDMFLSTLRKHFEKPLLAQGEQAAFFFDRQNEFQSKARDTFAIVKAVRDMEGWMGKLEFVSKEGHVPLQAVDLLAYIMRTSQARRIRERSNQIRRGNWEELLVSKGNVVMGYYDAQNLRAAISGAREIRLAMESLPATDDPSLRSG